MTGRIWILGASDPEMSAIEALLLECGETVLHATLAGARVHPGNMYRADTPDHPAIRESGEWTIYAVECGWSHRDGETGDVRRIDHHRPGDPGYGRPPEDFLPASSIGQVVSELARLGALDWWSGYLGGSGRPLGQYTWVPERDGCGEPYGWAVETRTAAGAQWVPRDIVLAAAADHCLGAAYRGECPGVDPDELMAWRAESRAAHQGRTVGEVLADVASAQEALREAPLLTLQGQDHCGPTGLCGCGPDSYGSDSPIASTSHGTGDCYCDCDGCSRPSVTVRDMRDMHTVTHDCGAREVAHATDRVSHKHGCPGACSRADWCNGWRAEPVAELPEAATRLGIGYMSGPLDQPDGRRKFTVSGSAEQVTAWMRWASEHGLTDIYGDAARGFAGGYEVAL